MHKKLLDICRAHTKATSPDSITLYACKKIYIGLWLKWQPFTVLMRISDNLVTILIIRFSKYPHKTSKQSSPNHLIGTRLRLVRYLPLDSHLKLYTDFILSGGSALMCQYLVYLPYLSVICMQMHVISSDQ